MFYELVNVSTFQCITVFLKLPLQLWFVKTKVTDRTTYIIVNGGHFDTLRPSK